MFETFRKFAESVAADLETKAKQFSGQKSMGRVAATAAMIAYLPDENADGEEIKKGVQAISRYSGGVYPLADMIAVVDERLETLKFDTGIGEAELMKEIAPAAGTEEADFLVRIAIAVGKASGDEGEDPFSDSEKEVCRRIIGRLGLQASTYGL